MQISKFLYLLWLIFFLSNCDGPKVIVSEPSAEEKARVEALGEPAALKLMETLKTALAEAIREGGVENAISVCNTKARSLTSSIAEEAENIPEVKRTSFKFRNPANAPDSLEKKALRFFENALRQDGELPSLLVQKIEAPEGVHFRYYKPMKAAGLCLTCHGDSEIIAENVKVHLSEHYPKDRAIGYQVGDFRGVIRVSVRNP